jgi:threonine aldolase
MNPAEQTNEYIDLRSDTVTRPTAAMRRAMTEAKVGDDVFGDDPTVNRLQEIAAEMLGTEAALFLPSGTQSNLCALLSHCQRGDEYIVGQAAHTYRMEAGGAAVLGSIQPQPLDFLPDGTLDLDMVAANIKPVDPHFARTRLLCVENTQNGKALPVEYLSAARRLVDKHALGLHLDGARVFNASVKLGVPVTEISRHFDSISICLSKGLCAPVGSVLCGSAELIHSAHRWRKMLGGGMRQAGVLAAAGILSLTEQIQHLGRDHEHAALLAQGLQSIEELKVDFGVHHTNMIFAEVGEGVLRSLMRELQSRGVLIHGFNDTMRLVTHHDFQASNIDYVIDALKNHFSAKN